MATPFARAFKRLRRQAGFVNAYQFFHGNGGTKSFGCSFPNYLRIENGAHLPKPHRLPLLMRRLKLPKSGAKKRHFVSAYLETLLKDKKLARFFLG